jgi:NAD(P)-dependent dehydrogenase (short-subunit alcohol dehydrogenase family)
MSDLKGKVAVVTGASKGIGAAIAKGLGAAGAAVVVNYAGSKEGAALSAMEGQRRARAALEDERKREWRSSAQKVDTGVNSFQR